MDQAGNEKKTLFDWWIACIALQTKTVWRIRIMGRITSKPYCAVAYYVLLDNRNQMRSVFVRLALMLHQEEHENYTKK